MFSWLEGPSIALSAKSKSKTDERRFFMFELSFNGVKKYLDATLVLKNITFQVYAGEKTRVILGKILIDNPDILLLDEPTNHLDMDSIEAFEEALDEFKGTVFFISHDRYFINNICQRIIAIEDYAFKSYLGNLPWSCG